MWALDLVLIALLANTCPTTWLKFVLKNRYMNVAYVYLADVFNTGDQLLSEARTACTATLSPYTPKAVAYHVQSHYCRFMIGHSLGRMDISNFLTTFPFI